MSEKEKGLVSHGATIFHVDDVEKSSRFYRDELGFEITFEWGDPIRYVVTNRDEAVFIHFSQKENFSEVQPGNFNTIYIFVHDVDAIYQELLSKNVDITDPIGDRDYGMRDFDIRDPDGNMLSFGKHISNE